MIESGDVSLLNLAILFAFLGGITLMGHKLSGVAGNRKDFFKAGGNLPWWVVSSSIIATVISSVTFIAVPAAVFKEGGNLFYIQILLGLMVGKALTALVVARSFYESKDCSTVFDYIGRRTEKQIGSFALVFGISLTSLNVGIRLLTTALVLSVLTGMGLWSCTTIVVGFSLLWSWLAGLKMVIWTDFLLFIVFTMGALFSVFWAYSQVDMPLSEAYAVLDERAKLALFDFSTDPRTTYTIWAGLIGAALGNLALAGTQATFQRVKACRSARDAQKAFIFSALLYATPVCMLLVGLALTVFYTEIPLPLEIQKTLESQPDRIFPYFVLTELPNGISGILIAAIFAAGISTIDTHLTEVADVAISDVYAKHIRTNQSEAHYLFASRIVLAGFGVFYILLAMGLGQFQGEGLLDLTFKVPNFVTGIILGTVVLARLGVGNWPAYLFGSTAAFGTVFFLQHIDVGFFYWPPISGFVMVLSVWALSRQKPEWSGVVAKS